MRKGDRVAYFSAGSYAEYTLANANTTVQLPDSVSFELGAVCPVAGMTALSLVTQVRQVKSTDAVLIHVRSHV